MSAIIEERSHLYIDGRWQPSSDPAMTNIISPATEQVFGAAPTGTALDVDQAVGAARRALQAGSWAGTAGSERAAWMRALADELAKRGDETAHLVSGENGMPISLARVAEGQGPAATLRYYADLAEQTPIEEARVSARPGRVTVVRRDPVGVVAIVVPWNFPQSLTMFKLAPALAAGCT
ncbi:aldehyde dehydrogenase family protein, partial [Nocardioides sp. GCM10030258]